MEDVGIVKSMVQQSVSIMRLIEDIIKRLNKMP